MMTEHGLHEQQKLTVYSLFVLYFLLTEGPMSGYELAQLIKERSQGRFKATAGNIYPSLHELKEAGDVEAGEPTGGMKRSFAKSPSKEDKPFDVVRSNNGNTSKTC